jgi:hypothetical protein
VQVDAPLTELATPSVFANDQTATGAVLNIYQKMTNESYPLSQNIGLLSDELINYSTALTQVQLFTNNLSSVQPNYTGPWQNAYNYVYQANTIMEGLNKYNGIVTPIKSQLMGEAKFIRAFWFFYLTNLYGDIPLALSTDYTINRTLSRTSHEKVFEQVVQDLLDAYDLLNDHYVDGSDTTISLERIRPNKSVTAALLARVYLYQKDYNNAQLQASKVIGNTSYQLEPNLDSVFLTTSREVIWQLGVKQPYMGGTNTLDAFQYIYRSATNPAAASIRPELLAAFEMGDHRRSQWIDSFTTSSTPTATYYFPFKYKVYLSSDVTEYIAVFRLAEQYLIRAEAQANGAGAGISGAISDLDVVRKRAGLLPYSGAVNKDAILAAVLQERRVEFFSEWGHRWFDLIRTGNADAVMGGPMGVTAKKGGQWDLHDQLYPIPNVEISIDRNLTQNTGYDN